MMMIKPVVAVPCQQTALVNRTICCSSLRSNEASYIPKLEPFSRSKLDRMVKDPPLIQKSENDIADYCSTLEGDRSYSCWRAYFELKDLENSANNLALSLIMSFLPLHVLVLQLVHDQHSILA
ncbi:CCG-binding protein 1 [Tanacetum coccineum]